LKIQIAGQTDRAVIAIFENRYGSHVFLLARRLLYMFSICRCDTYVYVINMQMCEICVCLSYADAKHMDMHGICMFLSFFTGIRKIS
ncbi:hypothetical protein CDH62_29995, partial [Escherichia coli]